MKTFINLNFLFTIIIFSMISRHASAYSVEISPNQEECFLLPDVKIATACSGSYEVISSNIVPIQVIVTGPSSKVPIYEAKYFGPGALDLKETEGSFSFVAKSSGDYKMCISNGKNSAARDSSTRLVAFNFRALAGTGEQDYEYAGLETELAELQQGLEMLKDHQSYMNQREDVHKDMLDSINTKVLSWTILEAIILVGMAIWQISYISNFFETKRKL
jgi:hypothetical protein